MKATDHSAPLGEYFGNPIRISRNGDKVVRAPHERWDMLLRRGVNRIIKAEKEFADKAWWVAWAKRDRLDAEECPNLVLTPAERARTRKIAAAIEKKAAAIEKKYEGVIDLNGKNVEFELGMIAGQLSGLRWVLGYDWDFDDPETAVSANAHPHRTDEDIDAILQELEDTVWWNLQQVELEKIRAGEKPRPDPASQARTAALIADVEKRYGLKNLGWGNFEWGQLNGRFSALCWVMGRYAASLCLDGTEVVTFPHSTTGCTQGNRCLAHRCLAHGEG